VSAARRFTREELARFAGATVPDLVGDAPPRLVLVGINPGLWTAATGTHFAHPTNRFYPALHRAGITDRELDRVGGLTRADRQALTERGIAITNLVARATARASELSTAELRAGAEALETRLAAWQPRVVAIAGVTAYRTAFRRPRAQLGPQEERLAGAALWLVPNPSGLNAHETIASLADRYRKVAVAAGLLPN
jgi:TDG/mug DNA glycosylase family protein